MLSIRTFARSAPRAISRMALRQPARPSTLLKAASAVSMARPAAFSTTTGRWGSAENDAELSSKLSSEIQIEEDIKAAEQDPSSVKDFLANTVFEIEDKPGNELVKLTRKFHDEKYVLSPF